MIYLDNAATTRVFATPPFTTEGNASSRTHSLGLGVRRKVENARVALAELIGCVPQGVVFTSGATESSRIVHDTLRFTAVSSTSHKCMHFKDVVHVKYEETLDLDSVVNGHFGFELVNNETGIIAKTRSSRRACWIVDATQAVAKIPQTVIWQDASIVIASAHKFHGPLGLGIIAVRDLDILESLVREGNEGTQERGVRPGTLNAPAIIQTGEVAKWMIENGDEYRAKLKHLQSSFENKIKSLTDCWIIGADQERAPHITSLNLPGVDNEALIAAVNDRLAIASGSACTSEKVEPSHVLMAMFNDQEIADTTVRISYGWFNTEAEVLEAAEIIAKAAETIRSFSL